MVAPAIFFLACGDPILHCFGSLVPSRAIASTSPFSSEGPARKQISEQNASVRSSGLPHAAYARGSRLRFSAAVAVRTNGGVLAAGWMGRGRCLLMRRGRSSSSASVLIEAHLAQELAKRLPIGGRDGASRHPFENGRYSSAESGRQIIEFEIDFRRSVRREMIVAFGRWQIAEMRHRFVQDVLQRRTGMRAMHAVDLDLLRLAA
jgi:hypothetical protein